MFEKIPERSIQQKKQTWLFTSVLERVEISKHLDLELLMLLLLLLLRLLLLLLLLLLQMLL